MYPNRTVDLGFGKPDLPPPAPAVRKLQQRSQRERARRSRWLGGKTSPQSGDPLDLTATVTPLAPELVQRWRQTKGYLDVPVGDCARLTIGGVDLIVSSGRH